MKNNEANNIEKRILEAQNLYTILGLEQNATKDDIKKTYRRLAAEFHPDKYQGNGEADKIFSKVEEAYKVLLDDETRSQYNALLKKGKHKIEDLNKLANQDLRNEAIKNQVDQIYNDIILKTLEVEGYKKGGLDEDAIELQKELNTLLQEHKDLRKEFSPIYPLGEESAIYKLLMSGNEKTITRLINNMIKANDPKLAFKSAEFNESIANIDKFREIMPPELMVKMFEVMNKVEERSNTSSLSTFEDALNKFWNLLKMVVTFGIAGISDKELKTGFNELNDALKPISKQNAKTDSFVDNLANERSIKSENKSLILK
jgi:curved DNA-binding protein CbpA